MVALRRLETYSDDRGNEIISEKVFDRNIEILFRGGNNKLFVAPDASISRLHVQFDCDNAEFRLDGNLGVAAFAANVRMGQDSKVSIGRNVSTTSACVISAVEGATISIGDDVMLASENEIRTDDAHPIFDVHTGLRINTAESITIGSHVWLARRAVVLGGAAIGDGSVIGFGSLVTGHIPNNCVAAGFPARVLRTDIAWERPHLSLTRPFYKPDASAVTRSLYWNPTLPLT